jgi:hypothetical protein
MMWINTTGGTKIALSDLSGSKQLWPGRLQNTTKPQILSTRSGNKVPIGNIRCDGDQGVFDRDARKSLAILLVSFSTNKQDDSETSRAYLIAFVLILLSGSN